MKNIVPVSIAEEEDLRASSDYVCFFGHVEFIYVDSMGFHVSQVMDHQ